MLRPSHWGPGWSGAFVRSVVHLNGTPPSAEVALGDAPTRGSRNAPVIIIEFADSERPCRQKIDPELKKLQDEFGGKLGLAFKDFPLSMHSHAEKAAEASRCTDAQGKFWEFHDLLFDNSKKLEATQLKEYARTLKLDAARFDKCLDSGEQAAAVQKDSSQAQRLGLTGTPSFFINDHFWRWSGRRQHLARDRGTTIGRCRSRPQRSRPETKTKTCIVTEVVKTAALF